MSKRWYIGSTKQNRLSRMNKILSNTWLQPGAIGKSNLEPFERLYGRAKTVETVWALPSGSTGLKPGVTEKAA
jgi:hypothetical protein